MNNANVKIHIRDVHSINKGPFSCNICGKVVKNQGSLRVHTYRFHTAKSDIALKTFTKDFLKNQF